MRRGTTPRFRFTLPFDIKSNVSDLRVTFEQNGVTVLEKRLEDCTCEGDTLLVWLTQEETLGFKAGTSVKVQLKALENDGNVISHEPKSISCKEILNEDILSGEGGI